MTVALNIFCFALMAFEIATFVNFVYMWQHEKLWERLQNRILIYSGIMSAGSVVVLAVLSIAHVVMPGGIDIVSLATAWVMFLAMLLAQSIIWGCQRDDLRAHEYTVLLSVFMYFVCVYASVDLLYKLSVLGGDLLPPYYVAGVLVNSISLYGMVILWHYVRLVGDLNGKAFHVATVVIYILAIIPTLIYLSGPLTGIMTVSPDTAEIVYADWYGLTFYPQYIIMLVILVVSLRAKMNISEKTVIAALMAIVILFEQYINFIDGVYITPLLMAIGGLACYQAVVVRRAREVERHLVQVDMASAIQQGMLPQEFPEDERFSVDAHMWPAKEVAGDFFDFYQPDPDNLYITIADVSGKDVPAAMFMSRAHALIREHEKAGLSPHEIFNKVNRSLSEGNSQKLFVTAWMGKINLSKGIITFANAGHNPPIITRAGEGSRYLRTKVNLVLGIRKKTKYKRQAMLLKRGDRFLLYTDGVTESIDVKEEQFGEERLLEFVEGHQELTDKEMTTSLFAKVNEFAEDMEQFDDVTVLCGTYLGDVMTNATGYAEEIFPADRDKLDDVNAFIEGAAFGMGYPEDHAFKLEMCIEELFVNVCNYAYATSDEKGSIRISVMAVDDEVQILFADMGIPFNPLMQEPPNFEERARKKTVGGLGIHLVRKFMDDVRYEYAEGENRLTIVKKIES